MHNNFIDKRYYELAEKWLNGTISPDEEQEFAQWYNAGQSEPIRVSADFAANEGVQRERMMAAINRAGHNKVIKLRRAVKWVAAAAILLVMSTAGYFWLNQPKPVQTVNNLNIKHDITPGGNKATLILANGKKIILDDAQNGHLANQGSIRIRKTNKGEIIYDASRADKNAAIGYNIMSTPRGGQYHLILADGTEVWLNAASSIKFPTAFNGNERRVEVTGEAYFEVAHNAAKPFRVASNGQLVEASVKTTLLEGKVKVSATGTNQVQYLTKGEQAALNKNEFKVSKVNTEAVVAWKNGQFIFDNDDIQHIMRTIARWYNVDIEYKGPVMDDVFCGTISRFNNVSEVLKLLQLTGKVHFTVTNNQITVTR